MPIDLSKVVWDDAPQIDPSKVVWDAPSNQPASNAPPEPQSQSGGASGSWTPQPQTGGASGSWATQPGILESIGAGLGHGMGSLALGAEQLLGHGASAIGLNMIGGALTKDSNQGLAKIGSEIAPYEAANPITTNIASLAGQIIPTLPALPASMPASLLGRTAVGATEGGLLSLASPITDPQTDFGSAKMKQGLLGAALGGAAAPLVAGIGRIVSPQASQAGSAAKLLQSEGVQLTPGQALGGIAQAAEDKLTSVPILGDAIRAARIRGDESLNRAVYNRVLAPIGESTDNVGRAAVSDAQSKIGAFYDKTLSGVNLVPDAPLLSDVGRITQQVSGMTPTETSALQRIVNRDVIEPLTGAQSIDGNAFKQIESQLTQNINRYGNSPDAHQQEVGDALSNIRDALRGALQRQNPQQAPMLQAANTAYANLTRLESAASKQGAHDGVFTAPQLANAVRQGDATVRKRGYAAGRALMQDLSDAAQSRMTSKTANSGTFDRAATAGVLGAGFVNPWIPGGLFAASIPYLPGISRFSTGLLSARPAGAEAAAELLRRVPVGLLGGALAAQP